MRPVTGPCLSFEDFSYFEAKPIPLSERPAPEPFHCPYAQEHESCYHYTPLGEVDLVKTLNALKNNPHVRCLLVSLPPEKFHFEYPIEPKHLAYWCQKRQSSISFHLQPRRANCPYPCGETAACLNSQQVITRELQETISKQAQSEADIAAAIKVSFPGLGGKQNKPIKYEILHAWATRSEPDDAKTEIKVSTLVAAFHLSSVREVYRILQKAKEINPKVFRELEKYRTQRAYITRGGEVRHV